MFKMYKKSTCSGLTRKWNPWTGSHSVGQKIVNLIDTLKQIPDNTLQDCFLLIVFPVDRFWKLKLHFMIKWHKEKLKVGCNFLQYLKWK